MFFSPAIQLLDTLGPATLIGLAAVLGLLVGSFLNVVIYRLPKMMEADWQVQAAELRGEPVAERDAIGLAVGLAVDHLGFLPQAPHGHRSLLRAGEHAHAVHERDAPASVLGRA